MHSSGTRARLYPAVTGALCVLALGACSTSGGSGASSTPTATTTAAATAGTSAPSKACTLLTKAEVSQATANSIAFAKQANGERSTCRFGSLSGFAVVLSVTASPTAGLSSDIPGLGNVVTKDHLTHVSGIGDQAYGGPDAIIARKGNTAFGDRLRQFRRR